MADWRKSISFSNRIKHTSQMQFADLIHSAAAYKEVNPGCESSEASRYAKSSEEVARKDALNLDEYEELCAKAVQFLHSAAPLGPVEDHHVNEHIFPNLPNSGARVGRYTNAVHYRDGLFSEVFCASHPDATPGSDIPTVVALKITTPTMMTAPHDSLRESRILGQAKGKNIIPLLETFQQPGGHLVLVFPFMPYDLGTLLQKRHLHKEARRTLLIDLFSGLEHLHSRGIIHRDIKPTNILLASPSGPAYLADFGIAWSHTDRASEPPTEKILDVGTTCYRPPELLFGYSAYGPELDLWAAGCVVAQIECLNEHTLFDAGDLGSELALIKSIFETLGTPDLDVWPEAARIPDWGKMSFTRYPGRAWSEILPNCDRRAVDLVSSLVVFESGNRIKAREVLSHPYLNDAANA